MAVRTLQVNLPVLWRQIAKGSGATAANPHCSCACVELQWLKLFIFFFSLDFQRDYKCCFSGGKVPAMRPWG